ncbi:MAG TPA: SDR family oxidoreductase [Gemmatimonadaceae bacterium]|nr:SDR family oxidoreductase [Gemmatimonadaceae bacterium]
MNLSGRVALVTGAGHRLGRALAVALGEEKMQVAVHFNSARAEATETAALIEQAGGRAVLFEKDLTEASAPRELVESVVRKMGPLAVVVNSAAVMLRTPVKDVTTDEWDMMFALNLRAPFFVAQTAAIHMEEPGAIINIADLAAFETWPAYIPHAISKAALVKMTESLARVLSPSIRVNAIAPGAVLPPAEWDAATFARLAETTPLKRLGAPSDVVEAMLYLLRADYVTGETIIVDGGRHIRK